MGEILMFPTLKRQLQASLSSLLPGQRVIINALGLTGRIDRWCLKMEKWRVTYDTGEVGYHDAPTLTRIGSQPQGDGMPGDIA